MEKIDYLKHIHMDIYYFQHMYNKSPKKIFISTELFNVVAASNSVEVCFDTTTGSYIDTCFGIPLQKYNSGKLEYYLSANGFEFEGED